MVHCSVFRVRGVGFGLITVGCGVDTSGFRGYGWTPGGIVGHRVWGLGLIYCLDVRAWSLGFIYDLEIRV